jgi:uncharacterized protein YqgC (DUF456 family)
LIEDLAWAAAVAGLLLGGIASVIPGFPGCAVALLGLVAFSGLTDFRVVGPDALVLAAVITALGAVGQLAGPVAGNRAAGGTAGSATGAALGAALGAAIPIPGAGWTAALVGAIVLGFATSRQGFFRAIRGMFGAAGGCLVGAGVDFAAVVALGGVLAVADFLTLVTRAGPIPS